MPEFQEDTWLAGMARRDGERIALAGNRRLSLADSESVWWVEEGVVDLIADRTHLGTLAPGALLCGIRKNGNGSEPTLEATGKIGTFLRRLDRASLDSWSTKPKQARDLGQALLPWIQILCDWSRKTEGGGEAVKILTYDGEPLSDAQIPIVAFLLGEKKLARLLDDLAADVLRATGERRFREEQAALARQGDRIRGRDEAALEAQRNLEQAGELTPTLGPPLDPQSVDLLFQTMLVVATAAGIELKEPWESGGKNFQEEAARIAERSRVRLRKVALRGRWWTEDHGPLLAQSKDGTPLALLPRRRGYEVVNRTKKVQRARLSDTQAEEISVFAFMLYRPLPDKTGMGSWDIVRFTFQGLGRDIRQLLAAGFWVGALGSAVPLLTGWLIDQAVTTADLSLLVQLAAGLLVVALASPLLKVFEGFAALRLEGRTDLALQAALWDRLLGLPPEFFRRYEAGDLADRMSGVQRIRAVLAKAVRTAALGLVSSLIYLGLMFTYSAKLALTGLGVLGVVLAVSLFLAWRQLGGQRQAAENEGRVAASLFQILSGISKIRVAGAESFAVRLWSSAFAQQLRATIQAGRWQNRSTVFQAVFPVLASLVLFLEAAAAQGQGSDLSTGQFVAFFATFGLLSTTLQSVSETLPRLAEAVPVWQRLRPILETPPEADLEKRDPGLLQGQISLTGVSFRYEKEGRPILQDIELEVRPGEFIALVGPSGSGKSTLLRLLLGFERPDSGVISYDGQELPMLDIRAVRRQIGVVLQTGKPFAADILQNIVGMSSHSLEQAMEAARLAGFEDDIRKMPMRWFTFVGEEGVNLSGGQRQRLMIARALLKKPKIIFMDEATSALDNRTQTTVAESLEQLKATRVVVAHRLSTIRHADRILVLERGKIVEAGSFDELMALDGPFARLARRQLL